MTLTLQFEVLLHHVDQILDSFGAACVNCLAACSSIFDFPDESDAKEEGIIAEARSSIICRFTAHVMDIGFYAREVERKESTCFYRVSIVRVQEGNLLSRRSRGLWIPVSSALISLGVYFHLDSSFSRGFS